MTYNIDKGGAFAGIQDSGVGGFKGEFKGFRIVSGFFRFVVVFGHCFSRSNRKRAALSDP
jgi:hypothetical protein